MGNQRTSALILLLVDVLCFTGKKYVQFYFLLILLKKGVYKAHFRHSCKSFLYILLDYLLSECLHVFSILLHKQDFAQ